MTTTDKIIKRSFDFIASILIVFFIGWLIIILVILSSVIIGGSGFYTQIRIGKYGKPFFIYKVQTLTNNQDYKISRFGKFLRESKMDELPQVINVLIGNMSFVGPRPDIEGFADKLEGGDRVLLDLRPGITGPASLYFRNEEKILIDKADPDKYNREVIWPEKVKININYVENYSFLKDIYYIIKTISF